MVAKNKAVAAIEERLAQITPGSERHTLLETARAFKNNWVELGEQLSRVMDNKLYETWGYASFDAYIATELHLKKDTAYKLLRSFTFMSSTKPQFLQPEHRAQLPPINVVDFISRKAEQEELPPEQVQSFAEKAFEEAWSPRTVSAKWRSLVNDDTRVAAEDEDKSLRAVRRAKELAERLNKALLEIPGLDPKLLDAVTQLMEQLDGAAQ